MARISSTALALAAVLLLAVYSARAFKPNAVGHVGITEEALEALGFCRQARDAIEDANVFTDIFEQLVSEAHFDDETLRAGSERLIAKADDVVELMKQSVENADDDDLFDLPFTSDIGLGIFEGLIESGLSTFGRGYLSSTDRYQTSAWTAMGQALHTLQDFYSHSNWVELQNVDINRDLGRDTLDDPPADLRPCSMNPGALDAGLEQLTTSYFDFNPNKHCDVVDHPGKCRHGWDQAGCPDGLNKDEPSRPGFTDARRLALAATSAFVQRVLDRLEDEGQQHVDTFLGGADCSQLAANSSVVFKRRQQLASPSACDSFSFTVDEVGEDYQFQVVADDDAKVTVVRDSGAAEVDGERSEREDDDDETLFSFELPQGVSGESFSVEVCGGGGQVSRSYDATLLTLTTIFPYHFYFTRDAGVRNAGDFPHTANQQPLLNAANNVSAELYGTEISPDSVEFTLVALDGTTVLQTLALGPDEVAFDGVTYTGSVAVSTGAPFFVRIAGSTTGGRSFVRVAAFREYRAQAIEVQYVGAVAAIQLGSDARVVELDFTVRNVDSVQHSLSLQLESDGDDEDFSASVAASVGSPARRSLASSKVSLGPFERGVVSARVELDGGHELKAGDIVQLTLVATADGGAVGAAADENLSNAVDVLAQYLGCPGEPVCEGHGVCDLEVERCVCSEPYSGDACGEVRTGPAPPSPIIGTIFDSSAASRALPAAAALALAVAAALEAAGLLV